MRKFVTMVAAAGAIATGIATPVAAETTGSAGAGAAINNLQPSLVLNQLVATAGVIPSQNCPGCPATATLGMIHTFASPYNAYGMPSATGQTLPIPQNTALYFSLGTTYGGNDVTTFALPNLGGRVAIGAGQAPGLSSYDLGQKGGAASTVMTLDQLATHDHGGATAPAGGGQPLDNRQPYLAMTYQIAVTAPASADADTFLGSVSLFAGGASTGGYLPADGRVLQIADYDPLYQLIGTTYGGDGLTTFALPDLRGRTAVGTGDGLALGETFGQELTTLGEANLPAHDHSLPGGGLTGLAGGALPLDNAQPSLALNYFINIDGAFPTIGSGGGSAPFDFSWIGEVVASATDFAPDGWVRADGQLLSIADYADLYSLMGTTFGGDGVTTFALPDLRGRTILGAGLFGLEIGQVLGERYTTLTENNLASHAHSLLENGGGGDGGGTPTIPGVPEPSAWLLLMGGFAIAGAGLRRRRALTA